jgi:uncharacterized repeat protein (TIGR01451 family)
MAGTNTVGGCSAAPIVLPPTVTKAFSPTSITVGGVSRLTITLSNPNAAAITLNAAFTDTLPSGVLVAAAPNPTTTCGGGVTATAGGSSVTLSQAGSTIPAAGSCTIAVNVTGATAGTFVNTIPAGALQTTAGNNAAPATATLTAACPVITLSPATLPNGTMGVAYSQTITGSGGTAPYSFGVTAGALPAGLTLTSAGVLAGTPTTNGTFTFTIRGTDANGCFAELAYTIIIISPVPTLPQWGASLLAAGLLGLGYLRLRRRSAAAARTA